MITQTWALAAEGLFALPLVLVRETLTGHEAVPAALDEQTALRSMEAELHARLLAEMDPQGEVREEHYTVSRAGGLLLVTLRARCAENIAAEAPITEIN